MKKATPLILFAAFALLTQSCKIMYVPNTSNVPLFKEANEVRATVSVNNYQAAYAVTDHIGVMVNGMYKYPKWTVDLGNTKFNYESKKALIEGGAGYFTGVGKYGTFEVYGGGGMGSVSFNRSYSDSAGNNTTVYNEYSAKTTRFFVQPSIGLSTDKFDLAFSLRYVGLKFSNLDTSGYTQTFLFDNDLADLDKPYYTFIEPALTLRAGVKSIKFFFQALYSVKLNSEPLNYRPFAYTVGAHITIAPRFKKGVN